MFRRAHHGGDDTRCMATDACRQRGRAQTEFRRRERRRFVAVRAALRTSVSLRIAAAFTDAVDTSCSSRGPSTFCAHPHSELGVLLAKAGEIGMRLDEQFEDFPYVRRPALIQGQRMLLLTDLSDADAHVVARVGPLEVIEKQPSARFEQPLAEHDRQAVDSPVVRAVEEDK